MDIRYELVLRRNSILMLLVHVSLVTKGKKWINWSKNRCFYNLQSRSKELEDLWLPKSIKEHRMSGTFISSTRCPRNVLLRLVTINWTNRAFYFGHMVPVVRSWWNFQWSFFRYFLPKWNHRQCYQERTCHLRLGRKILQMFPKVDHSVTFEI